MVILALNTKDKHICNLPDNPIEFLPNKDDEIWLLGKQYKVLSRLFQYNSGEIEIINIMVRQI